MSRLMAPAQNRPRFSRPAARFAYRQTTVFVLGGLLAVGLFLGVGTTARGENQKASPTKSADQRSGDKKSQAPSSNVMAVVNGEKISRDTLARECLRYYGESVLESYVNKLLTQIECEKAGVSVTREEIDEEVKQRAARYRIPVPQWYEMLENERGISPKEYDEDIVWSLLALQKLAGSRLTVSQEELQKVYETEYGPAVMTRMIACKTESKAKELRQMALANPAQFGEIAKNHSDDTQSASGKGRIPPIRRHVGYLEFEQAAFGLEDGGISEIIQIGERYIILKRENMIPAREIPLEQVAPMLKAKIKEAKLSKAADEVFAKLQKGAKVENWYNDPKRRESGMVAVVNGRKITTAELAAVCLERHGKEVLETTIDHMLVEQARKKNQIEVTEVDLAEDVRHAAEMYGPTKPDGKPDIDAWLKIVTEEQDLTREVYLRDFVWPSVVMKKIVEDQVRISEEEINRGFEANYGPKVQCLAIFMDNLRRAQEVWAEARKNPTPEHFGELAATHSVEPGSKRLHGQVSPIHRHGGMPVLEKEAFALKKGELSGIIHVGGKYVILLCQGFTKPVKVEKSQVRQYIYEDLFEKKLHLAISRYFARLKSGASIDNFLSGTSQSPADTAGVPELRETTGEKRR